MAVEPTHADIPKEIGDLQLDHARRVLLRGKDEIRLPKLSYEVLLALVRHAPGIVSNDQLLDEVWGKVVVSDETVKQRISLLRQALDDDADQPRYIESVRGVGYRLVAPVRSERASKPGSEKPSLWRLGAAVAVVALILFSASNFLDNYQDAYSLAVLPFDDLSQNSDKAYFSDGIHEEVTGRLANIASFSVVSRTSVLPYRDTSQSARDVADALDVDLVVKGSVRHANDRVRISVQLIDPEEDRNLWAENYERPLSVDNIFEIQADVAENIARALQAELTAEDKAAIRELPTDNIVAYDNYLLGRFHMVRANAADLRRAVEYFERAIDADRSFAQAYAALGQTWNFVGTAYGWLPPNDAFPVAESYIDQAIDLGYRDAGVMAAKGDVLAWYRWQWDEAEAAYRDAMAQNDYEVLAYMLLLSVLQRHEEALLLTDRVVAAFPRDSWVRSNAAWRYLAAGEADRAIVEATVSIEIDNRIGDPYGVRGWAYLALGELQKAHRDFEQQVQVVNRAPVALSNLAHSFARMGQRDEALALVEEIMEQGAKGFVPPEIIGHVYAALGDADEAFRWLEMAFEVKSRGVIFLDSFGAWNGVKSDPRFEFFAKRIGLPLMSAN